MTKHEPDPDKKTMKTPMARLAAMEKLLNRMENDDERERALIYFCAVHGVAPKKLDAAQPGNFPP